MGRRAVAVVAAGLLTGCSPDTLDAEQTEQAIRAAVTERFDVAVETVTCPEDVEAEQGGTFRCTVRAVDGSQGRAVVTQQDDEGRVRARTPFLRVADVERLVSRGLAEQSAARRVRLTCPDIVVVDVGGRFRCRARADGRRAGVRVTQQDAAGGVRWELLQR